MQNEYNVNKHNNLYITIYLKKKPKFRKKTRQEKGKRTKRQKMNKMSEKEQNV